MRKIKATIGVLAIAALIGVGVFAFGRSATTVEATVIPQCKDILAPDPVTFEKNVAKFGTVMATFQWFEDPEGTWTLKMDVNPSGNAETWVSEYPSNWHILFKKPVELPQTIVEYSCPVPEVEHKYVTIQENCDETIDVTIRTVATNRNWRVGAEEHWLGPNEDEYTWVGVASDSAIQYWHNNQWKDADLDSESYTTEQHEAEQCEVPEEPEQPSNPPVVHTGPSTTNAPSCGGVAPVLKPINPLIKRLNGDAIAQWVPTEGDRVHIYYYELGNPSNAHALRDVPNDGYEDDLHLLGSKDWVFGIQQANGCAGGEIVWIVDGATNYWTVFTPFGIAGIER